MQQPLCSTTAFELLGTRVRGAAAAPLNTEKQQGRRQVERDALKWLHNALQLACLSLVSPMTFELRTLTGCQVFEVLEARKHSESESQKEAGEREKNEPPFYDSVKHIWNDNNKDTIRKKTEGGKDTGM